MRRAFASAVLLAIWTCATSCWGQEAYARQLSPALQIKLLRERVVTLESEKKELADQVQKLSTALKKLTGRTKDAPPPPDPRIGELEAKNEVLGGKLTEAENALRQLGDDLTAARALLDKAQSEGQTTKTDLEQAFKKIATLEAANVGLQNTLTTSEATVERQRQTIEYLEGVIAKAGKPFWPWGAVAVVVAAALGVALTRTFWTKPVIGPMSVSVKLGDWEPKPTSNTGSWTPTFSVRSELLPRSASVHAVREPLVREVRDVQPGAV